MALDREIIPGDDSTGQTTVVTDAAGGLAIDYSAFYERIATAVETMATNSSSTVTQLTSIVTKLEALITSATISSTQLTTLATEVTALRTRAEGAGIHTVGALDWIGLISVYKLYVEEPNAAGLEALTAYLAKINALPKGF